MYAHLCKMLYKEIHSSITYSHPNRPLVLKEINKLWYFLARKYYSAMKMNNTQKHSQISQSQPQKNMYSFMIPLK